MLRKTNFTFFVKIFLSIFIIFSSSLSIAQEATQEKNPSIKFDFFSADQLITSDIVLIDEKYSKKHNVPVLAPFKIKIPRQDGVKPFVEFGNKPNSMIIKINFVTGGENAEMKDRELIENLQYIPFNIDMADNEDRIKALLNLMSVDAFNMVTKAYEKKEYIGARSTKLGNIDVVDVLGKYIDPNTGLTYVRITGYLNPNDENGIYSVANIIANKYNITSPEQLSLIGTGFTIASFEYLN